MSEFNQGAYDAFLSSIADLTSRDLAQWLEQRISIDKLKHSVYNYGIVP